MNQIRHYLCSSLLLVSLSSISSAAINQFNLTLLDYSFLDTRSISGLQGDEVGSFTSASLSNQQYINFANSSGGINQFNLTLPSLDYSFIGTRSISGLQGDEVGSFTSAATNTVQYINFANSSGGINQFDLSSGVYSFAGTRTISGLQGDEVGSFTSASLGDQQYINFANSSGGVNQFNLSGGVYSFVGTRTISNLQGDETSVNLFTSAANTIEQYIDFAVVPESAMSPALLGGLALIACVSRRKNRTC
ncbi:MAG: hypothetical protein AAF065_08215 [Verrucomicrobiota bacterium]